MMQKKKKITESAMDEGPRETSRSCQCRANVKTLASNMSYVILIFGYQMGGGKEENRY